MLMLNYNQHLIPNFLHLKSRLEEISIVKPNDNFLYFFTSLESDSITVE